MRSFTLISLILALVFGSAASAAPIVDTFAAGDGYMVSGFVLRANANTSPVDLDWAFLFTLEGKGYKLESYKFPLLRLTGDNEVELLLMADNGGQPGMVIESLTAGVPSPGSNVITVASKSQPQLDPNTSYWFGMSARSTSGNETMVRWHLGGEARAPYARREDGGAWEVVNLDGLAGAFRLEGAVTVAAEAVSWARIKALY